MAKSWTVAELERYEQALKDAGITATTVTTYINRPRRFLEWLTGE